MRSPRMSRRSALKLTLGAVSALPIGRAVTARASTTEVALPPSAREAAFEPRTIDGWSTVAGQWTVEEMAGLPPGGRALVQRATTNEFDVIVAPAGPFTDVDVSVKFEPLSGRQDASGGIVFRLADGKYYVVRANALEDNFRLYYYDGGRRQLASVRVKPPALGRWHALRVVAVGDRIQASLDGTLLLDHRDRRFSAGRVGLWTKADSVTAFRDLTIRGVPATS